MNLRNLLTASALRNPHKAALIFQEESVSYEQLDATTTSLAQPLLAQGSRSQMRGTWRTHFSGTTHFHGTQAPPPTSESSASKIFRHSGMTLVFKYHV